MDFVKPTIEYAELSPLLIVLGVACLGVIVEAFLPRERRHVVQTSLAGVGVVAALGATVALGINLDSVGDGAAQGIVGAEGSVVVDGPTIYLWGLVLVFALGGVALFAERKLEAGVSAFAGQAAALPGTEAEREASTPGPGAHRGLPAADVRRRRHAALPGLRRPAHHVRRARGALAAALPALRARPSSPPAEPGGGDEVLPPRRLLLGLLPLRRRAGLRLRRLDELRGHQRGRASTAPTTGCCCSSASRCSRSGCSSRSAPCRSRPGPPTSTRAPRPRSPRSCRPAPRWRRSARCCASSTSPSAPTAGTGSRCCGSSRS